MIQKFFRRNTRVEAVQYDGENFAECRDFAGADKLTRHRREEYRGKDGQLAVRWVLQFTHPLGTQSLYPGHWLIKAGGRHMMLAVPNERFFDEYTTTPHPGAP